MACYIEITEAARAISIQTARPFYDSMDLLKNGILQGWINLASGVRPAIKAKWKKENSRPKSYLYVCSNCGKIAYFSGTKCGYNFCPNCGRDMRGDRQ